MGDPVATGPTAFDATIDSNLEEILLEGTYTNLLFCGFTTDHCVAETMDSYRTGDLRKNRIIIST